MSSRGNSSMSDPKQAKYNPNQVLPARKRAVCGTIGSYIDLPIEFISIIVDYIFYEWQLVSGSKECIQIWRGTLPDHPLYGHPFSLIQLPDGRLASGAQENCIYIYSKPQTGKDHKGERVVCEQTLSAHNNPVWTLATLNDGRLVSGACERIIKCWDTRTSRHDDVVQVISTSVFALAVLNDGRLASGSAEGLVEIWPVAPAPNPTPLTVQSAAAIPLPNGGPPGSGSVSAGPGGAPIAGVAGGTGTGSVSGGPGGAAAQSAAAGSSPNGSIDKLGGSQANLQPLQTGVGRASVAAPVQPRSQPQLAFKGHRAAVWALQTLPGDRIASGSNDRTIRIWDTNNGHCLSVLRGHTGNVSALSLTREGWLVSGSEDTTVKVWNTMKPTYECMATMRGHTGDVNCVVALPDGRIASGSNDKTIKIWSMNGVLEATLKEQTPVLCLAVMLNYDITTGKGMKL